MDEGPEGVKWELGFAYLGYDLATGTGKKVACNGNGKD